MHVGGDRQDRIELPVQRLHPAAGVDGLPDDRELHLLAGSDVAGDEAATVHADTDTQRFSIVVSSLPVEFGKFLDHRQGGAYRIPPCGPCFLPGLPGRRECRPP